MKKLLWILSTLLILGLGFLFIVKNPELGISQTILKAIGLERLTISDEPIAMGPGTFTLDEIGATFTLPIDRTLSGAVMTGNEETTFILSTPEVDNKKYPMYIRGSVQKSTDTLEEVQQTSQVQLTGNGQIFSIDCDGVSPSKCLGVFINSGIYIVGLSSQSNQPDEDPNAPTSVYFPRFAQIQDAINAILYSAVVVPPVMTGSELSGEMEFTYPPQNDITVTKTNPEFTLSSVFNAAERVQDRKDCEINKSLQYFTDLLSKFSSDIISEYIFTYTDKKPSQADMELNGTDAEGRKIYILPNRAGYTTNEQFIEDFGTCGVAGMIPLLVGKKYILFIDGCGSGAGEPFGCTDISNKIQKYIQLQ